MVNKRNSGLSKLIEIVGIAPNSKGSSRPPVPPKPEVNSGRQNQSKDKKAKS